MSKEFYDHMAVIDLETLGKASNACILSLGLTLSKYSDSNLSFESLVSGGLYIKFDLKEQLKRGRTKQQSTIEWWYEQSSEAKVVLKPTDSDISVYGIKDYLKTYFDEKDVDIRKVDFYDRNSFDLSKIQDVIEEDLGEKIPWDHKHTFEISTALRFRGFDRYGGIAIDKIPGVIYHNALHDAAVDHIRIMNMLYSLDLE